MKKFLKLIFSLFVVATFMNAGMNFSEAAKKVVAVMPLENVSGYDEGRVAQIMTEELVSALYQSHRYSVIERNQMATVLREVGFQMTGAVDMNKAVQVGKLAGAQYVVVGKVTMAGLEVNQSGAINDILGMNVVGKVKGKVALQCRFIDVQTGEIKDVKEVEGSEPGNTAENAIYKACKEAAEKVLVELVKDIKSRVVDSDNDIIYIDAGRESGFRKGETLIIIREGSPIIVNGKIVGMKETTIGKAKVTEVNDEYSICKVTSHSDVIKKGDVVKRGQ